MSSWNKCQLGWDKRKVIGIESWNLLINLSIQFIYLSINIIRKFIGYQFMDNY